MDNFEAQEDTWKKGVPYLNYGSESRIELINKLITPKELKLIKNAVAEDSSEYKRKMESAHEQPSPRDKEILERAKYYINWLRSRIGLPPVPTEEMEVTLIPENLSDELLGKHVAGEYHTPGGTITTINFKDDLLYASCVVHELIHKYIDLHVGVSDKKDGNFEYSEPRSGLSVTDKSKPAEMQRQGVLLNELPNYYYQFQWMILEMKNHESTWIKNEMEQQRILDDLNISDKQWVKVLRKEDEVRLWSGYFFPGTVEVFKELNNSVRFSPPLYYMELATNLTWLVNEVNGKPLMEALLEAKADPKKQQAIKEALDGRIRDGFYHQLKQTKFGNSEYVVKLLGEVQKKIKEELGEKKSGKSEAKL